MSLLTNPLQSGLLLQQAVLPYTFTTGELDSLKAKLQAAENQIMQTPNKQATMLPMSAAEIRTLLRMIDMTYLQGLSGSGHYVSDCGATTMSPMLHNQQFSQALSGGQSLASSIPSNNSLLSQLNGNQMSQINTMNQLNAMNAAHSSSSSSSMNAMNAMAGMNMNMGMNGMNGMNGIKNPPPANYVCHKCNVLGHWIQECPLNTQQQQDYTKPPPANYICHRCGVQGHWIKNCPTNGNPTFDNKPHLKVIKTSENQIIAPNQGGINNININADATSTVSQTDNNANNATASQPPSKKRRLNQM